MQDQKKNGNGESDKKVEAETHMFSAQKQTLQTIYIKICGEICEQLF